MAKYIFDKKTDINFAENRIIENCLVEINAPVTIYGKMFFRNCTLKSICGIINVYGVLKIENCQTQVNHNFLHIMNGGEYQLDMAEFNDGKIKWKEVVLLEEGGHICWIPYKSSIYEQFEDIIMSCVSNYYNIDEEIIYSVNKEKILSECELSEWKDARRIAIFLKRKIIEIPEYQITEFNYPSYLTGIIDEEVERSVENGDERLWKKLALILIKIAKKIYKNSQEDNT